MPDIELLGAVYSDVPAVTLPTRGGGSVTFYEPISPYGSDPEMDGTASAGSSDGYARGDHVHPTDTSRAAASHAHGNITSDGDISAASVTVASGDCIVVNDDSEGEIANGPVFGSDESKFLRNDGTWQLPKMTILSYGHSTWTEAYDAFMSNNIVYCRASSQSNPANGAQGRMAFLAYTNSDSAPTEFEYQYYRSVQTHSDSTQGDQVFIYKLKKASGWEFSTRNAYTKVVAGAGLTSSYASGAITLKASILKATLPAANWSSGSQSVSVTGVTASNNVLVAPAPASSAAWRDNGVLCTAQASNSLTFTCDTVPDSDIVVNVHIGG